MQQGKLRPSNYNPYDPKVVPLPGEEKPDGSDVLWTPGKRLCIAAHEQRFEDLQRLLEKNVCPDDTDMAGYTALHYAARNGDHRIVLALLAARSNPNAAECSFPPLLRAAYMGHTKIAVLLLERKADPSVADSTDGLTALHKAAAQGHGEMVTSAVQPYLIIYTSQSLLHRGSVHQHTHSECLLYPAGPSTRY